MGGLRGQTRLSPGSGILPGIPRRFRNDQGTLVANTNSNSNSNSNTTTTTTNHQGRRAPQRSNIRHGPGPANHRGHRGGLRMRPPKLPIPAVRSEVLFGLSRGCQTERRRAPGRTDLFHRLVLDRGGGGHGTSPEPPQRTLGASERPARPNPGVVGGDGGTGNRGKGDGTATNDGVRGTEKGAGRPAGRVGAGLSPPRAGYDHDGDGDDDGCECPATTPGVFGRAQGSAL
mmetsp:Transcript_17876/g.37401  ORF Transcript_17876/g.37401 Transcript_17876/m.37401 type:complete len:230 (+) Transcript_17876:333-1022(+)